MKILITGGAGFIGSHLVEHYLKDNEVVCLDHFGSGQNNIERAELIKQDVTEPVSVDCDLILHFASRASPPDYQANPFDTINANTIGTLNMLRLAEKNNCPMIFASTSEIYGNPPSDQIPTSESFYGLVNSCGPRSCYDESKRLGETYCYEFAKKGVDIKVVRIFNTYGPRMRPDDGRVVINFIWQTLHDEDITVYGVGKQGRSYCYISDLVAGIDAVVKHKPLDGPFRESRVFNIGNPNEHCNVFELAKLIKELTGSKSVVTHQSLPKDDPDDRVPDISRVTALTGWEPVVPLREGLLKTIDYFRGLL